MNYNLNAVIPKDKPAFINNIESIINYVKNKIQLKLVDRNLIEYIYEKNL